MNDSKMQITEMMHPRKGHERGVKKGDVSVGFNLQRHISITQIHLGRQQSHSGRKTQAFLGPTRVVQAYSCI